MCTPLQDNNFTRMENINVFHDRAANLISPPGGGKHTCPEDTTYRSSQDNRTKAIKHKWYRANTIAPEAREASEDSTVLLPAERCAALSGHPGSRSTTMESRKILMTCGYRRQTTPLRSVQTCRFHPVERHIVIAAFVWSGVAMQQQKRERASGRGTIMGTYPVEFAISDLAGNILEGERTTSF